MLIVEATNATSSGSGDPRLDEVEPRPGPVRLPRGVRGLVRCASGTAFPPGFWDLGGRGTVAAAPDGEVWVACLEPFFMHIRAITDFLCCRPGYEPRASDFSARDFVPGWQATPADAAARLAEHWPTASQQIAHYSRQRLQLVKTPAELTHVDVTCRLAGNGRRRGSGLESLRRCIRTGTQHDAQFVTPILGNVRASEPRCEVLLAEARLAGIAPPGATPGRERPIHPFRYPVWL